jgi:hypothetical protein
MECSWCDSVNQLEAMVCGARMPMICKDCGTKLGYIDWSELNKILVERDYYKKKFYEQTLTKQKG